MVREFGDNNSAGAPPENVLTWLFDVGLVTVMGDMLPPRDPNDDDDEDEEDEEDEDREEGPAVIREPDE